MTSERVLESRQVEAWRGNEIGYSLRYFARRTGNSALTIAGSRLAVKMLSHWEVSFQ